MEKEGDWGARVVSHPTEREKVAEGRKAEGGYHAELFAEKFEMAKRLKKE